MGITQKALSAGVPVCVVPLGRDQPEVAKHVLAAHAGTVLAPRQLEPEALLSAIRAAITMRDGAERVAAGFARAGDAQAAADAVQALPSRSRSAHATAATR